MMREAQRKKGLEVSGLVSNFRSNFESKKIKMYKIKKLCDIIIKNEKFETTKGMR